MFRFFGGKVCRILAPPARDQTEPSALEGEVFTTRPPGKSLPWFFASVYTTSSAPSLLCAVSMVPWERDRAGDKLLQRPQSSLSKLSLKSRLLSGWLWTPLLSHSHSAPQQVKGQWSWPPTWQVWVEIPDEESGSIPIQWPSFFLLLITSQGFVHQPVLSNQTVKGRMKRRSCRGPGQDDPQRPSGALTSHYPHPLEAALSTPKAGLPSVK